MNRISILLVVWAFICSAGVDSKPKHWFAVLGNLKYNSNFEHFNYVNPKAPKGGHLRLWYHGNFDSLNPFILKGQAAAGSNPFGVDGQLLTFESLMIKSADEEDSYYGLIASEVDLANDRRSIIFTLRPRARWHDGSLIKPEDIVYSFVTLKSKGHPAFKILLRDITSAAVISPLQVRFVFKKNALTRDLPATLATMPIISQSWYEENDFAKSSMLAPLGSGPYKIETMNPGRSITYRRVENHWAETLPVYKGRFNFKRITWDYYRDRDVALEALFAGKIDFREDFTSRNWATKYDRVPAVKNGRLIKEVLPDHNPSGFQAFFINTRRTKFSDRRVRQAIGLVFDFEWTNKNLFHKLYKRTHSIFQNSDMEAKFSPVGPELALLQPWSKILPREVFGSPYQPPKTNGSGDIRKQLRQARDLLKVAGWTIKDGNLTNKTGQIFKIEFLSYSKAFERIVMPYIRNLEKLGINARFRLVEPAQYQHRIQGFDFDITTFRNSSSMTPGITLRSAWKSDSADLIGSRNYTGLRNSAVDDLIERIIQAKDRTELYYATRALDRIIMWSHNLVPQWFKASHTIAYWDLFGRPSIKPRYALGILDTWWWNPAKALKLGRK